LRRDLLDQIDGASIDESESESDHLESKQELRKRVGSGSTDSSSDFEGHDEIMSYGRDDNDDDSSDDKESSAYESSDDVDDEGELKLGPLILTPMTVDHPLSERERQELIRLIESLGVPLESISISQLTTIMIHFHAVAIKANISLLSPKYRYLLKRAYISYLCIATTFYGTYFSSAEVFPTGVINSAINILGAQQNSSSSSGGGGHHDGINNSSRKSMSQLQNVNVLYSADWDLIKRSKTAPALICLSINSLLLLDPDTWEVRMSTHLWDIQDFQIIDGGKDR